MTSYADEQAAARLKAVEEHVALENQHNLDGIMATFGETAYYDDLALDAHYQGHDAVRGFYQEFLEALPDLFIDVLHHHASAEAIVLEVMIRGHHLGTWRGLPGTGRRVEFPLCAVFTFDEKQQLAGEKIYYDRATVLRQIGMFHEPERLPGRITTAIMHPLTMARIVGRKIFRMH